MVLRETFCRTIHLAIGTHQSIWYAPQTTHSLIYQFPESMAAYYFLPAFLLTVLCLLHILYGHPSHRCNWAAVNTLKTIKKKHYQQNLKTYNVYQE